MSFHEVSQSLIPLANCFMQAPRRCAAHRDVEGAWRNGRRPLRQAPSTSLEAP